MEPVAPAQAPPRPPPAVAQAAPAADPVVDAIVGGEPARHPGPATRGRPPSRLLGIRQEIPLSWRLGFGALGVAAIFGLWFVLAGRLGSAGSAIVPTPGATVSALGTMWSTGTLRADLVASIQRIAIGYSISVALAIVVGLAIGTFPTVQAFFEPQFGFLRYIPATALTPLFLLWLGIDESPKIWLIVVGTFFFNVLMIADVVLAVPRELINASYTLGAGRARILRSVVLPHSVPGIIDVARINLAAGWLMLVVAEILAAKQGLAFQIINAQRFRAVDRMFALLIVFGIIGLVSDLFLRWLRHAVAPWNRA
jgi:NitT/TauT family transport system permease protein